MLKIKDNVDLKWLMYKFDLRYATHCDEPGQYIFYSDTFYIDIYDRTIHIEGRNLNDLLFLYNLIQAGLVEKEF
ncbi:MAG: hypothetical protein HFJ40_05945 [Clostridia bacterium]|nr:hypothetical protein [Clostridia bacterium]